MRTSRRTQTYSGRVLNRSGSLGPPPRSLAPLTLALFSTCFALACLSGTNPVLHRPHPPSIGLLGLATRQRSASQLDPPELVTLRVFHQPQHSFTLLHTAVLIVRIASFTTRTRLAFSISQESLLFSSFSPACATPG
ncbi:hypothetical protein Micbo1qcDRAFT_160991 [Microdochium bolleyi]|uniref:Uncharacterized protein n=1 Tax=Microdochium bolleyi TaxID=196109 RepID=A0A136J7A5_9PEZI|nr:hypothetical protein Micbo1qcDRAFT_160991 [Microdochium bolleyi]